LLLQSVGEGFAEFGDLGGDDGGAVGLVGIVGEILLVVVFGGPELVEGLYLGDDRVIVNAEGVYLVDDLYSGAGLIVRVIKDRRAI
jgi:hypothetical protein